MSLAFVFIVVAFVVICLASFVYIIIMGPSRYHREGFVGKVYDKLIDSPNVCCGYFLALFFGCNYVRGRQKWRRCADHTLHERNYFMVIFYILLVWPVEILYIFGALPTLRASLLSKVISISLVIVSEFFYALAMFSDPGIVTSRDEEESHRLSYSTQKRKVSKFAKKRMERRTIPDKNTPTTATTTTSNNNNNNNNNSSSGGGAFSPKNRRRYLLSPDAEARQNKRYPVDGILFALACESPSGAVSPKEREAEKGVSCTTCCVPRPSRSKHCRLCNYCVRRFDHHCPWINNDVAEGTHRWFMLFLFCHAVSCLWAAWDLYVIMREFLVANKAWGWVLRLDRGKVFHLSLADYMFILLTHKTLCMCLFWFAIMIGFVLWVFWAYQMMFVTANLTTNDMNKIDDAVDFITNLPPLDAVHAEAMKVRCRLEMIAAKPPRKLQALEAPPEGEVWTGREAERYRKKVHKALQADLRGIYDRGVWKNIMEVLFPYS